MYSFKLNYSHGLVSGITNLSTFLLTRPEALLAGPAKFLLGKMFLFLSGNLSFSFFHTSTACKCWKDVNSITHGKKIILLIKLESFQLPRSVLSRLEISVVLMDVFVVSFKLIFFLGICSSLWKVRMTLAFLEGLSVLSTIYIRKLKSLK